MNAKFEVVHLSPHSSPYRFSFLSNRIKALIGIDATVFLIRDLVWMQQVHPDDRQYLTLSISNLAECDTITLKYRVLNNEERYLNVVDVVSLEKDLCSNELTLVGNLRAARAGDHVENDDSKIES